VDYGWVKFDRHATVGTGHARVEERYAIAISDATAVV